MSFNDFRLVMKQCMEDLEFSNEDLDSMTSVFFEGTSSHLSSDDFIALLNRNPTILENVAKLVDEWLLPSPNRKSQIKKRSVSCCSRVFCCIGVASYIRRRLSFLLGILMFLIINFGLATERFFTYRNSSVFVQFARSAGQCLNFTCTLMLVFMLRKCLTIMRCYGMGRYLPLDHSIRYHKLVGYVILFYSSIHTIAHCFNFKDMSMQPRAYQTFVELLFPISGKPFPRGYASLTGWIILLVLLIIVITSLPFVRRSGHFEVFYYFHLLYIVFYCVLLLHGPQFWQWFLPPGVLFVLEALNRLRKYVWKNGRTHVVQGILLPSKVVHLVIKRPANFKFSPGDYVFVQIPSIAKTEWHPFTISSAPEMTDFIFLHIRAEGSWTNSVYYYFVEQERNLNNVKTILNNDNDDDETSFGEVDANTSNPNSLIHLSHVASHNTVDFYVPVPAPPKQELTSPKRRYYSVKMRSRFKTYTMPAPNTNNVASQNATGQYFINRKHSEILLLDNDVEAAQSTEVQDLDQQVLFFTGNTIRLSEPLHLHLDGPYGTPSSDIFHAEHAVLIATGIGVTPFASILQSIMFKYLKGKFKCPHCNKLCSNPVPADVMKLRKVDFVWINRNHHSFEWFVSVLSRLEMDQAALKETERFLDIHMYVTSAHYSSDMSAIALQLALDLMHEKKERDLITGLKSRAKPGRPQWQSFFQDIKNQKKGRVTVFCCGPPKMTKTIKKHCTQSGFAFKKENF